MPESFSKRHCARLDVVMKATLINLFFFFFFKRFCGRYTTIEVTKKAEQNGTCLVIGLTVRNLNRNEFQLLAATISQCSLYKLHSEKRALLVANFNFFLLNVSETE